jgi:hypothetical protein
MDQILSPGDPLLRLIEDVEEIVTKTAARGGMLRIGPHAERLRMAHAAKGLSHKSIADELIGAAARAGIPVEMDSSA